jgi:thiol-disulfide isomerase/thioredoxin
MYGNYGNVYPTNPTKSDSTSQLHSFNYDIENIEKFKDYLNEYGTVVVKAWATWCEPCKSFGIKYDNLSQQLQTYTNNKYIIKLYVLTNQI